MVAPRLCKAIFIKLQKRLALCLGELVFAFCACEHVGDFQPYLELALRAALPQATLDDGLRRAAQKAGVKHFKAS